MKLKFRPVNLIWIVILGFLLWFFLWPVTLTDHLPETEDLQVNVMDADGTETVYQFPAGSHQWSELRDILSRYRCYHTLTPNGKNTNQNLHWEKQILIQSAHTAIYAYGSDKLTLNNTILRMGWFQHDQASVFFQELLDLLQAQTP